MSALRDHMTFLIAMGIFFSLVLFIHGTYSLHQAFLDPDVRRVKRRLRAWSLRSEKAPALKIVRISVLSEVPWLHELLVRTTWVLPLRRLMKQAGVESPVGVYLAVAGLLGSSAFTISTMQKGPWPMRLGAAAIAGGLPFLYLFWKRKQRLDQFERQFAPALELIARAMQAGHAFSVGMKMVGDEYPDPIGAEFDKAVEEINFGIDVPEALKNMSQRIDSHDLRIFVTSILVQRETGGNLAEILQSISRIIRQRFELHARVRALSAQGRLSALILAALPFVAALALYLQSRDYLMLLTSDPVGYWMLTICAALFVLGVLTLRRMVAFRV